MAERYSAAVLDHYRHPRNVGAFDPLDPCIGTGVAGAVDTGALTRIQIKVDKSGIIGDSRFKTYGCGSTIAAASLASTRITGCTLDEAAALPYTELARELELPPVKTHCSVLAVDAIRAAVEDYRQKQRDPK